MSKKEASATCRKHFSCRKRWVVPTIHVVLPLCTGPRCSNSERSFLHFLKDAGALAPTEVGFFFPRSCDWNLPMTGATRSKARSCCTEPTGPARTAGREEALSGENRAKAGPRPQRGTHPREEGQQPRRTSSGAQSPERAPAGKQGPEPCPGPGPSPFTHRIDRYLRQVWPPRAPHLPAQHGATAAPMSPGVGEPEHPQLGCASTFLGSRTRRRPSQDPSRRQASCTAAH